MTRMGDSIRRRTGRNLRKREEAAPRDRARARTGSRPHWWRWILGGLAGIGAAFGIGWLVAVLVLFPKPALAGDEVAVPELTGMTVDEVREELSSMQLRVGALREMVHPFAPHGEVVAQDPVSGQRLRPGAEVRLAVSQGRARVTVPDLVDMPADAAVALARRVGFEVDREDEPSESEPGRVLRTRPAAGTQTELPRRLLVIVSAGGIQPADTTPAATDSLGEVEQLTPSGELDMPGTPRGLPSRPAPAEPRDRSGEQDKRETLEADGRKTE